LVKKIWSFSMANRSADVFSNLFQPIQVGNAGFLQLPNRIVMGSMHTGLEELPEALERLPVFYQKRAEGGTGLIVTGGISPNKEGCVSEGAAILCSKEHLPLHEKVVQSVHNAGEKKTKIFLQILHTGRYAMHKNGVAPSEGRAPISPFKSSQLSSEGIERTIQDFVNCALLAQKAGYDGIEIMGSEGYLINQFLSPSVNLRSDNWGGNHENRMKFPIKIVEEIKKATEKIGSFCIMFRISLLELVPNANTWDFNIRFAKELQKAGVHIFNTGIGWHESRVPTIATMVPRGAFAFVAQKFKPLIGIPLVVTNRFNTPEVANDAIANGTADLVSLARPLLADPEFPNKAKHGRAHFINTCIACNQACLDHIFEHKTASCLVNPYACFETKLKIIPQKNKMNVAVIGAGPAGLSAAMTAAQRNFNVTLFERGSKIGGQFNLASKIPGKEEFTETLRFFKNTLEELKVKIELNSVFSEEHILSFDKIIFATGVFPRTIQFKNEGNNSSINVMSYADAILSPEKIGHRVAVVGAGGIGFDVCELVLNSPQKNFYNDWGIDTTLTNAGGLKPEVHSNLIDKKIYLLQRKTGKMGDSLGKTTGWIHRISLKKHNVEMISGVEYGQILETGLEIKVENQIKILPVDTIIVCAGQESERSLYDKFVQTYGHRKEDFYVVGGAKMANAVDAKRAILEGTEVGLML
jgi:2,4-dienoyl-CoA reductase (NADPH2)